MVTQDTSPFDTFSPQSRVWIFQTTQALSAEEVQTIQLQLTTFMKEWTAHQMQLTASFGIYFQHFLVISIDQKGNHATGCSLDALHQKIASLGETLGKDFFDRLSIPVWKGDQISFQSKKSILQGLASGELTPDTRILDQTIQVLGEWKDRWITPISRSWIKPLSTVN